MDSGRLYSGCNPQLLAMKNQKMSSKSQGRVAYFLAKKYTSLKYKKLLRLTLRRHCAIHRATAIPSPNAIASRPAAHCAGVAHPRLGSAESIILSVGGPESMMLSACAESIILSVPPTESMMLSV